MEPIQPPEGYHFIHYNEVTDLHKLYDFLINNNYYDDKVKYTVENLREYFTNREFNIVFLIDSDEEICGCITSKRSKIYKWSSITEGNYELNYLCIKKSFSGTKKIRNRLTRCLLAEISRLAKLDGIKEASFATTKTMNSIRTVQDNNDYFRYDKCPYYF